MSPESYKLVKSYKAMLILVWLWYTNIHLLTSIKIASNYLFVCRERRVYQKHGKF